jgi:hypothetical protein
MVAVQSKGKGRRRAKGALINKLHMKGVVGLSGRVGPGCLPITFVQFSLQLARPWGSTPTSHVCITKKINSSLVYHRIFNGKLVNFQVSVVQSLQGTVNPSKLS